ncbi:MAG: hypothetical protein LUO93_01150 [Methanomicrobiales archaeon]|nr:hypothetical protein [Methanomicrobiales archaeon]
MSAFSDEQLAALRKMLEAVIAQVNKANAAQQLLSLEIGELLLEGIQQVGNQHLAVLGLLIDKGIITGAELDAKQEEMKAQWQVNSIFDPRLAELNDALSKMRQMIEELKATLKENAGEETA